LRKGEQHHENGRGSEVTRVDFSKKFDDVEIPAVERVLSKSG